MARLPSFSKRDLKSGYHQLELHPSCRYITTFSTHVRLYKHKRVSFGINSAAEIFQSTIQTLIADILGVRNVGDNIVVYGRNQNEHDAALDQTLRRLHESGLTINPTKGEFNKPSIEFFVYILTMLYTKRWRFQTKLLRIAKIVYCTDLPSLHCITFPFHGIFLCTI